MTRHGGLCNTYHTRCNSIGTYDIVQENLPLRASFIIDVGNFLYVLSNCLWKNSLGHLQLLLNQIEAAKCDGQPIFFVK